MTPPRFDSFFHSATGVAAPYGYQCRLACGEIADPARPETLELGTDCASRLISIPTGLGKTAAVVLAWLWNRTQIKDPRWPRRLVYCLPMRTLVEQTRDEVEKWLKAHGQLWDGKEPHDGKVGLYILMGGEDGDEWDIHPEREAILIGTQDMLLSRALNRGYGMSRYRWPMHFGLLNNDCLWVVDETQLMGVGVETSSQLDGFRHDVRSRTVGACPTWWMSATLEDSRLTTVDHPSPPGGWPRLELSKGEKEMPGSRPRMLLEARKAVSRCEIALSPATKADYAKKLAALVVSKHQTGTLTLVVVNRVARAREIYQALTTVDKKSKRPQYDPAHVGLIHSRFRPKDRKRHEGLLLGGGDRIVIATQAVEAGVDVSARLLITELAPWSSLVQRMGRCNRRAEFSDAEVYWVDIEADPKGELLLPYEEAPLRKARAGLSVLPDASSEKLQTVKVEEEKVVRPVVRRRDIVDLFDTTPDICGQDLDISRYIRDGEDSDVQFFWRDIEGDSPSGNEPSPKRIELCCVSIGDATKFMKNDKVRSWLWNPLERKWESAKSARPGAIYLVAADSGGYEDAIGWTGEPKAYQLTTYRPTEEGGDAHDSNTSSFNGQWLSLDQHTSEVVREAASIAAELALSPDEVTILCTAALWHDIGKAHSEFQAMLCDGDASREGILWAKSGSRAGKCARPGFRHELASALAWLWESRSGTAVPDRDLVAYLIAAHHGKVRLSIRSLPNEKGDPKDPERLFARGIWHREKLPAIQFDGINTSEAELDLSFMKMGEGPLGSSWLSRAIALRDRLGPFRLALLETLLRAADARASAL